MSKKKQQQNKGNKQVPSKEVTIPKKETTAETPVDVVAVEETPAIVTETVQTEVEVKEQPEVLKKDTKKEEVIPTPDKTEAVETVAVEISNNTNIPDNIRSQFPELSAAMATGKLENLAKFFGLEKKHNHLSADGEVMLLNIINQRLPNWDPNDKITIAVGNLVDKRLIRRIVGVFVQDGIESGFGSLTVSEEMYPLILESFADFGVHLPAPTILKELDEAGQPQMSIDFQEASIEDAAIVKIRREREIEAKMHTLKQNPLEWPDQKYASDVITSWFTADKTPEGIDKDAPGYLDRVLRKVVNNSIIYLNNQKIPTQVEGITDWEKVPKGQVMRTILFDIVPETPTMLYAGVIKTATNYIGVMRHPLMAHLKMQDANPDFSNEEIKDILTVFCEIRAKADDIKLEELRHYKLLSSSTMDDYVKLIKNSKNSAPASLFIKAIKQKFPDKVGDPTSPEYYGNILNTILTLDSTYKEIPNNLVDPKIYEVPVEPSVEELKELKKQKEKEKKVDEGTTK